MKPNPFQKTRGWTLPGVLLNMSVPPRTEILVSVQPIHGITVISLPRCLILNGIISGRQRIHETVKRLGKETGVLPRLARLGCGLRKINTAHRTLGGVLIGTWKLQNPDIPDGPEPCPYPVCPDLPLTIAILSRRISNLYLSHRPPDYTLSHLIEGEWLVDDSRLAASQTHLSWADQCAAINHPRKKTSL